MNSISDPTALFPKTIEWSGGRDGVLSLLDQTLLPQRVERRNCATVQDVWEAIRSLRVRGAPAIGVAAAYGMCVALRPFRGESREVFAHEMREAAEYLCSARPTAVNLAWAVSRVTAVALGVMSGGRGQTGGAKFADDGDAEVIWDAVLDEAGRIAREDIEVCRKIGEAGASLIRDGMGILTHCNAGALATAGSGTALSPMYVAKQQGKKFHVYADETRPLMQGARLTAYELSAAGIETTVLCDNMAASLMASGRIQLVVVGADRIAANGDTANKIGTYGVAILARHHKIPFYVAAPTSTFDLSLSDGGKIPIEHRSADEVKKSHGNTVVPEGVGCYNPAFDVTPAGLISGFITEFGRSEPVTEKGVLAICSRDGL